MSSFLQLNSTLVLAFLEIQMEYHHQQPFQTLCLRKATMRCWQRAKMLSSGKRPWRYSRTAWEQCLLCFASQVCERGVCGIDHIVMVYLKDLDGLEEQFRQLSKGFQRGYEET